MKLLEATQQFTLGRFNELKNIVRVNPINAKDGTVYTGDTFECNNDLARYLMGDNENNLVVVKELKEVLEEENKEQNNIEDVVENRTESYKRKRRRINRD